MLGGRVEGGDAAQTVWTIAKIQEAQAGAISFLSNLKYEKYLYETQASAVIVNEDFQPKEPLSAALIRVKDAYSALGGLLETYQKMVVPKRVGIEQPSYISPKAQIGQDVYVGAFAYIGDNAILEDGVKVYPHAYIGDNCRIGAHTVIYSGAKLYHQTQVGHHCTIHAGAVVGSEGFGFAPQADGTYKAIPQVGNVVLGNYVDVGANTTIDRATLGATLIADGAKLDNLIQIGHNVQIGKNTALAAQSGVSGSTVIGDNCMIAGQAGLAGHLNIADKTIIAAQAGIMGSVEEAGTTVMGSPAFPLRDYLKSAALFRKLPDLLRRVNELEKKSKD